MRVRILCAIRDAETARIVRCELESETCTVDIARSGQEAIAYCSMTVPDVLVIDAVLPGMDGLGVIDSLRGQLGCRMPRVIAGSMMTFAERGFCMRGVTAVVELPWNPQALCGTILEQIGLLDSGVDWEIAQPVYDRACDLLEAIGMRAALRGFDYLGWAAALAYQSEARLDAVGSRLYQPIARRYATTAQSVERLIRHAVESTMNASRARGVYGFFGNTIDPTRGKPTNAQMISVIVQKLRTELHA